MPNCSAAGRGSGLNKTDFTELPRFVRYAQKMFHLNFLAGAFTHFRPHPENSARAVALNLFLRELAHIPRLLQLQSGTPVPEWQRWALSPHPSTHYTLHFHN